MTLMPVDIATRFEKLMSTYLVIALICLAPIVVQAQVGMGVNEDWAVAPAFPNLPVPLTVTVTHNPVNGQLWVTSWDGLIQVFDNEPDVSSAQTILDLRDRVLAPVGNIDGGVFGVALHPEFGQMDSPFRNYFYVYHASFCPLNAELDTVDLSACNPDYPTNARDMEGFHGVYLRLSRFEIPDEATEANKASEVVLFNIRYINAFHRGGGPIFGMDGYLYMAMGDQSNTAYPQTIHDNLNGGVLRLAVDVTEHGDGTWSCPANSHLPPARFRRISTRRATKARADFTASPMTTLGWMRAVISTLRSILPSACAIPIGLLPTG